MTPVEIIAAIFAIIVVIKFIVLLATGTKKSVGSMEKLIKTPLLPYLMLAALLVIGYYLLQTLDIVTIAAVALFTSFLYGFSFSTFGKEYSKFAKTVVASKNKLILAYSVWLIVAVWTLYALFV
jgi:hypothetical protein